MLLNPLIEQLQALRLRGMAAALTNQLASTQADGLPFEDRLALLVQHEVADRAPDLQQPPARFDVLDVRSHRRSERGVG